MHRRHAVNPANPFGLWFWLVVLIAASGCASGGPAAPAPTLSPGVADGYVAVLQASATLHRALMVSAGVAHAAGALTDDQLETVRLAGRATEDSLRAAQAASAAYLRSGGSSTAAVKASSEFLRAEENKLALIRLAKSLGVTP